MLQRKVCPVNDVKIYLFFLFYIFIIPFITNLRCLGKLQKEDKTCGTSAAERFSRYNIVAGRRRNRTEPPAAAAKDSAETNSGPPANDAVS